MLSRVLLLSALAQGLLLFAAPAEAAEPAGSSTNSKELDFDRYMRLGDEARATGAHEMARRAYLHALRVRPGEPTALGRLGLSAAAAGDWVMAARYLFEAMLDNGGATPEEAQLFASTFTRARGEVAKVNVTIDTLGASAWLDGNEPPGVRGKSAFFLFVAPGLHDLRAEAPGRVPWRQVFEVERGSTVPIDVQFVAMPRPVADVRIEPEEKPVQSQAETSHRRYFYSVGLGAAVAPPGTVPGVGLGPVALADVRWQLGGSTLVSVGFDVRMLRGLGSIEGADFGVWGFGATLPFCGWIRPGFACLLAQVETVFPDGVTSLEPFGAFGLRLGVEPRVSKSLSIRFWGDIALRTAYPAVTVGGGILTVFKGLPVGATLGGALVFTPSPVDP